VQVPGQSAGFPVGGKDQPIVAKDATFQAGRELRRHGKRCHRTARDYGEDRKTKTREWCHAPTIAQPADECQNLFLKFQSLGRQA
jgi:hypothetical protein